MICNLKLICGTVFLVWVTTNLVSSKIRHRSFLARRGTVSVLRDPCDSFPCYPPTGNLLVGRENSLSATSTCGLSGEERYCVNNDNEEKCFRCDSRPQTLLANSPLSHRIDRIIRSALEMPFRSYWWQSENGVEDVTIQLDLESVFDVTHFVLVFKSLRPKAMYIEKSLDFGKTWTVAKYFAQNCSEAFPGIPKKAVRVTDITCDSRFSSNLPSTEGEVVYRVFPPKLLPIANPMAEEIQNLMKMTNIRIRLTKLHTLAGEGPSGDNKRNYYYAIYELLIRGGCRCNGHASKCIPMDKTQEKENMVYPTCQCLHNTAGDHCEVCDDEYNLSWKPSSANVCKNIE